MMTQFAADSGGLMYNIAVMGDKAGIYGFGALGFDIYPINENDDASKLLKKLASEKYAVIFITEALAAGLENEIDRYAEKTLPAIILIPGASGNTGAGIRSVKRSVEKAVGSDIIFGGQ